MVSSTVDLNLSGLPPGATKQFEPSSVIPPAQTVLTVTTSTTTPLGLYPLIIAGSGGGFTNTTQVTLTVTVPDFTLSPFPLAHTVYQHQDATYTVSLDATPLFTSPVALNLTNAPGGTSNLFVPPAITPGETATLTITTGSSAVTGTHTLVISGTGGGLTRTTSLTLTILPAAIELTATPSVRMLYQGQSAIYTLSLDATPGFESPVTLTMGTLSNTVNSLSSDVLWPGQSATLTITTGLSTLANTHTLAITGASSGLSDTTTLTLKVLAAAITMTATPSSQVTYQAQSASYALALSATPGLTLPVTLSTDAPLGMQSRFVPNILWPNEIATLILTSSLTTTVGTYPMMITGTGTILSGTNHFAFTSTAQVSLTVLPADFALEMTPFACTAFQGEVASFLVELTSTTPGFALPIALDVGGVPNGTPFGVVPSEITSGTQATLSITTTGETPVAYHELTITGTVGGIERSAGATLRVMARVFLPIVVKRWPPIPDVPVLTPIDNIDQDNFYQVSWASAYLADTYTLEEATDALFSDAQVAHQGTGLSWTVPSPGKTPDTYYYRVKAHNSWGDSSWSSVQIVVIYPLFVGLELRWDGEGYIRGSSYYDIGYHLERDLNGLTDADCNYPQKLDHMPG